MKTYVYASRISYRLLLSIRTRSTRHASVGFVSEDRPTRVESNEVRPIDDRDRNQSNLTASNRVVGECQGEQLLIDTCESMRAEAHTKSRTIVHCEVGACKYSFSYRLHRYVVGHTHERYKSVYHSALSVVPSVCVLFYRQSPRSCLRVTGWPVSHTGSTQAGP